MHSQFKKKKKINFTISFQLIYLSFINVYACLFVCFVVWKIHISIAEMKVSVIAMDCFSEINIY